MKDHPQYTPGDSLALCQGYAPYARRMQERRLDAEEDEDERRTSNVERPTPKW
jgi:hypothetical protein